MEIKNLLTPQARASFESVSQGIKRKVKPLADIWSDFVAQNVEVIKPAVQNVSETVNTSFVEPIVQPIQQAQQKTNAIGQLNSLFSEKWINADDIKALAEEEGLDFNEVITTFQNNGIKVEGMEELQAQQDAVVAEEANKPFALDVNPEYDEVTALSRVAWAIPKFQYSSDEWMLKTAWKMVWNLPASALQVGAWIGDIGLSYLRNLDQWPIDALTETAKAKIINPTIAQWQSIADTAQEWYKKYAEQAYLDPKTWQDYNLQWIGKVAMGTLWAVWELSKKWSEFIVENPVGAIMTWKSVSGVKKGWQALKTAWTEAMKGNIGKATTWLAKSTGIGLKENIIDPIKMGVTAPFTVAKLWAKGIWAIAKKTEIGKKLSQKAENAKTYLAGLDDTEIGALEKTSPTEIDTILKQAEQTKGKQGDYVQTPYHVGAEKAKKTLNQLDADLKTRQSERLAVLDEAPIAKIEANDARMALKDSLRSMNVEDIQIIDGVPKIIPVKWREALLDLSNPADVKALQKLNEILDWDVSPTQTMDRVKKLQEWAYENKSTIWVKGTSERMDGLIKRVQGSLNSTFKKQLPEEYAKVLDSMSEDIKLSNEIKRVFGIDDAGNPVWNRGEMVMKRLANGTTTGGEARTLAKQIFDRYWIDLIKEARLRQMAMDLVWDSRWQTLFWVIKWGKQGIIDKTLEYAAGKIVNKEKLVKWLARGKGEVVKKQEPLYTPNAFRKAMAEEFRKPLWLPSPTWKWVSAKNVDLNIKTATPKENAMTQKVWERPWTQNKAYISKKEKQKPIQKKNVDRKIIEESKKVIKNAKISTTIPKKEEIKLLAPPKWVPKKTEVTSKPNATIKPKVSNADTSDTIPEGYFKNAFWEIVKKPNWKKGGFIKVPWWEKSIPKELAPLVEEAKKYKSAEEFVKSQPKLYRWQKSGNSELNMNNPEQKSNMLWDALHFTTDENLAKQYGKVQEIPFLKKDIIEVKDVERITKEAQEKLDKLVEKWVYEWKEYDMLEELAIGKYPDIAKHLKKPFIRTWRYNDTEILYFPEYDTTKSQLTDLYNQVHSKGIPRKITK